MEPESRKDWNTLSHQQRLTVLARSPIDQVTADYAWGTRSTADFRQHLAREIRLWQPGNVQEFKTAGRPPTKDVVLGAWRDLDRAEALLELIDNSIDEFLRRRRAFPAKSAPELNIYIDIDDDLRQLTYEDNAGGVSPDKLEHLVVPGYSDTTSTSATIGSYKTGGKKAVFRLAEAAQIISRYWSPAETAADVAIAVQLDPEWLADPTLYEFPYTTLKDKSVLERGQTRYVLQLRDEPVGGPPWFGDPTQIDRITRQIRQVYTLLFVKHPEIHIYFLNRLTPLEPLDETYDFSGTNTNGVDIRPQRVVFQATFDNEGKKERVDIEIVLGCRTSTAVRDGRTWGIDLYGNDRLFVAFDQTTFASLLPAGASRALARGYINIRGPNVFVPWDTHKRHLNVDRDIMQLLTKHKLIEELFGNWKTTYNAISSGEVKKLIGTPLPKLIDRRKRDLAIPHDATIAIDPEKKRGKNLTLGDIFVPKVRTKKKQKDSVQVKLTFTSDEARTVSAHYGIRGDPAAMATELAASIKLDILKKARR